MKPPSAAGVADETAARLLRRPSVSVVMPVRDEAANIDAALAALLAGDYPADRLDVWVVDGGSTDGTIEIVRAAMQRDARVHLVGNPRGSAAAGLNAGIAASRGDVVVRMDGHALPAPDYVSACVRALQRTGASAVGGAMVGRGRTAFGRAVALATASRLGAGDARFRMGGQGPVDTVYLGAWPRAVLRDLGGFDEALLRNQDYELAVRIRASGGTVWLDPAIRSTTLTRSTVRSLARQYFDYGTGRAATLARHPASLRVRQVVPALFVAVVAALGLRATGASSARALLAALAALYAGALAAATACAARRAAAPLAVLVRLPLAYAVIHVAWGAGLWFGLAVQALRRGRPSSPGRRGMSPRTPGARDAPSR